MKWNEGMEREIASHKENNTWDLVQLPPDRKALPGRWVYCLKPRDGEEPVFKARWVAKGYMQCPGLDFEDMFVSVVKIVSLRTLFAIAAVEDQEIEQMDVVTTFLHGDLAEDVYVVQPEGFQSNIPGMVCHLNKSLYRLKQSPRAWFRMLASFLNEQGYSQDSAEYDQNLYATDVDHAVYTNG